MFLSARKLAVSAFALGFLATPVLAQDAGTIQRAATIRDQAMASNIALDYVTQLTTRFGPRPAGSHSEQAAAVWAADYMRAHGFQNVRIEDFPLVGWERGEESASVVGDHPQRLMVAALGHSPGTNGVIEAEVVRFTSLEALNAVPAGSLTGKIAYVDAGQMVRMQDGAGYGPLTRIRGAGPSAAASKGALAFIMRSAGSDDHRMPHTGTTRYVDGRVPVPGFALSAPDADQLSGLVGMGEPVRIRLSSTAHTYETHSQNVIGDNHIIAGESDFGADRVYSLGLPPGAQGSDFAKAAGQVLYPIGVLASQEPELHGGADIGDLAEAGVPVFGLAQDGTRYFDLHHTADDTLNKIDPEQMSQNVAAWAGLVWLIADSDVDFRAMRSAAAAAADGAH